MEDNQMSAEFLKEVRTQLPQNNIMNDIVQKFEKNAKKEAERKVRDASVERDEPDLGAWDFIVNLENQQEENKTKHPLIWIWKGHYLVANTHGISHVWQLCDSGH